LDQDNKTLVMKFGGTSVGDAQAVREVCAIIRQASQSWPHLVIVISAMAGVTNMLLKSAERAASGDIKLSSQSAYKIFHKHDEVIRNLITDPSDQDKVCYEIDQLIAEFTSLCQAILVLGETTPRALDAVAALGERMSVRMLSAILTDQGLPAPYIEATQLIVTDDQFQDAYPDMDASTKLTRYTLQALLENRQVPIITGFIAASSSGILTTLGRGGSDYSAALIATALQASELWIWTDVDGVMTTDPRLAPNARTIAELSYKEIAELAYFGAKVLHPKSIRPVIEAGIDLHVRNTFNPDNPGTRVTLDPTEQEDGEIKAVAIIDKQRLITIEGRGMLGVPGVAARTFSAVAATGTSVPLITQASSEQSICFAVPTKSVEDVISSLEIAFENELRKRDIDRVWSTEEVVIVTVVGAGMRHTPGIAGRIFSALGANRVNVIAIAQGSSEVSISLVVSALDAQEAVLALHELISGN